MQRNNNKKTDPCLVGVRYGRIKAASQTYNKRCNETTGEPLHTSERLVLRRSGEDSGSLSLGSRIWRCSGPRRLIRAECWRDVGPTLQAGLLGETEAPGSLTPLFSSRWIVVVAHHGGSLSSVGEVKHQGSVPGEQIWLVDEY